MRVAGKTVAIERAPERRGEQQHSFVDVSKAATQLDWRPSVTLEAGLKKTYDWFAARAERARL
jgi:UDP-glucose 4-epimerase